MSHTNLKQLCNIVTDAHTRFQQDVADIDPIVGVNQSMRKSGIPADAMTIDCLKNQKRILLILHDDQPDSISYQFSWRNKDPSDDFMEMPFDDLAADLILGWMKNYMAVD